MVCHVSFPAEVAIWVEARCVTNEHAFTAFIAFPAGGKTHTHIFIFFKRKSFFKSKVGSFFGFHGSSDGIRF